MKTPTALIIGTVLLLASSLAQASAAEHLQQMREELLKETPSKTLLTIHVTPVIWEVAQIFASPKIHAEYDRPETSDGYRSEFSRSAIALLQEINPACSSSRLEELMNQETKERGEKVESMLLVVSATVLSKLANDDCTARKAVELARLMSPTLASHLEKTFVVPASICSRTTEEKRVKEGECREHSLMEVLTSPGSKLASSFERPARELR